MEVVRVREERKEEGNPIVGSGWRWEGVEVVGESDRAHVERGGKCKGFWIRWGVLLERQEGLEVTRKTEGLFVIVVSSMTGGVRCTKANNGGRRSRRHLIGL